MPMSFRNRFRFDDKNFKSKVATLTFAALGSCNDIQSRQNIIASKKFRFLDWKVVFYLSLRKIVLSNRVQRVQCCRE